MLDLAKVADSLLFMLDPLEGWDVAGDYCLSCIFAQGLPSYGECGMKYSYTAEFPTGQKISTANWKAGIRWKRGQPFLGKCLEFRLLGGRQ